MSPGEDLDAPDFDLSAAGLRADGSEIEATIEVMARKLEEALPAQTRVERRAKRMLGRDRRVCTIEVRLGDWRYTLSLQGQTPTAWREREVGGIAIKREQLDPARWLAGLTDELRASAERSAEAREALARLLG